MDGGEALLHICAGIFTLLSLLQVVFLTRITLSFLPMVLFLLQGFDDMLSLVEDLLTVRKGYACNNSVLLCSYLTIFQR